MKSGKWIFVWRDIISKLKNFVKLANTNVIPWNDEFKALRDAKKQIHAVHLQTTQT